MSAKTVVLVAALLLAACSSASAPKPPPITAGSGGTGASGSGGGPAGTGGEGGAAGSAPADAAPVTSKDAAAPQPDGSGSPDQAPGPSVMGGTALMVVGKGPLIGDDLQIQKELENRELKMETVAD